LSDLKPVIKSVINHYKWPPLEIEKMYCDDFDYYGLMYWYYEVKEIVEKSKLKK
jgi:hypothetical protein